MEIRELFGRFEEKMENKIDEKFQRLQQPPGQSSYSYAQLFSDLEGNSTPVAIPEVPLRKEKERMALWTRMVDDVGVCDFVLKLWSLHIILIPFPGGKGRGCHPGSVCEND